MKKTNFLESSKLLRDTADDKLKFYAEKNGEDLRLLKKEVFDAIDPHNVMIPVDFYKEYYNHVIKNFT